MGEDQLLITGGVPHPEGFLQGYCQEKKVFFRTDLAAPAEITGDSIIVQSPTIASFINHCLQGNIANKRTWEVRGEKLPIIVGIQADSLIQVLRYLWAVQSFSLSDY